MTEFYHLLIAVLALAGMTTQPTVKSIDYDLGFYSYWNDTVSYNQKGYPCENNLPLCYMVLAHEVGGHRYALTYCKDTPIPCNTEEFAYLQALNITVNDERANNLAYQWWYSWRQRCQTNPARFECRGASFLQKR